MKSSVFFPIQEKDDTLVDEDALVLDVYTSEWLFHVGMWDQLNAALGTDFSHFDQHDIPVGMIGTVIGYLDEVRETRLRNPIMIHRWVNGFTIDAKDPLKSHDNEMIATNAELVAGVAALRNFLEAVRQSGRNIHAEL
jgi:hypothetical protein